MQAEYDRLQLQLKKNRRFIYFGFCLERNTRDRAALFKPDQSRR